MKTLKGWRTIVGFAIAFVSYVLAWPELTQVADAATIAKATAVAAIIARLFTSTQVGRSE